MSVQHSTPASLPDEVVISSGKAPTYVQGRRSFFKYRDLGVTAGSHGRVRAQITSAEAGMSKPTGWHVHHCEGQFVYILKGWVDLEFSDRKVRVEAGDSIYIPGETPHNETATSDSLEILEVSVPADMGTTPCEAPAGMG
jgi:mannose-6-phosphate isomerase-like protein (cupin superfamily)